MSNISELQVLRSAAGYYIGRTENGMPYSRVSGDFRNKDDADWKLNSNVTQPEQDPYWEDTI